MLATTLCCTLTTLLVLTTASLILVIPRHTPLTTPRTLLATSVGALTTLALVTTSILTRHFFLAINIAYCAVMIAAPLAALELLLLARRRTTSRGSLVFAVVALALVPIGIDATFIEPWRLTTERSELRVASERALPSPLTISILADIQTTRVTDHERDAVSRALAAHPDLILLPGDLVQVSTDDLPALVGDFRDLLAPLDAPLGVYCVQGNCESKEQARLLLAGTRVRFLDNEIVHVAHAGRRLTLCGVDLGFDSLRARAVLREMELAPGDDDLRLVLAHRPDVVERLHPGTRVDLVVAGHTHGGQVCLPFLGPPITLSSVPNSIGAGGLHDFEGRSIYVSRGIGWEHGHAPRVRFLCAPEVSVLTLRRR